jgi:hypothetical protein
MLREPEATVARVQRMTLASQAARWERDAERVLVHGELLVSSRALLDRVSQQNLR